MDRVEFMNRLVRQRGYSSYLEIGSGSGETLRSITARYKVGVDPDGEATFLLSSDAFFQENRRQFDLVFIDGLHLCEQVIRDVNGAMRFLNPGGMIVLHDCLPLTERHQSRIRLPGPWTGDVWKAVVALRAREDCDVAVLDCDWGLGVVLPRRNTNRLEVQGPLTWERFQREGKTLLRVLSWEAMQSFLSDTPSALGCV
jgi:hypothetical protein